MLLVRYFCRAYFAPRYDACLSTAFNPVVTGVVGAAASVTGVAAKDISISGLAAAAVLLKE